MISTEKYISASRVSGLIFSTGSEIRGWERNTVGGNPIDIQRPGNKDTGVVKAKVLQEEFSADSRKLSTCRKNRVACRICEIVEPIIFRMSQGNISREMERPTAFESSQAEVP